MEDCPSGRPGAREALLASPLACPMKIRPLLLALLVLVGPAATALSAAADAASGKRVLVLHSYYKGYKWTDDEHRGISAALEPVLGVENVFVEYMDTKRFFEERYVSQLPEAYRRKYLDHRIDLIVATDDRALEFLVEHRDDVFPGTPVVFCGVNYFREEKLKGRPLFTGVSEDVDVGASLDTALALHPGTQPDLRRERRHGDGPGREGAARRDRSVLEGRAARAARRPADGEDPRPAPVAPAHEPRLLHLLLPGRGGKGLRVRREHPARLRGLDRPRVRRLGLQPRVRPRGRHARERLRPGRDGRDDRAEGPSRSGPGVDPGREEPPGTVSLRPCPARPVGHPVLPSSGREHRGQPPRVGVLPLPEPDPHGRRGPDPSRRPERGPRAQHQPPEAGRGGAPGAPGAAGGDDPRPLDAALDGQRGAPEGHPRAGADGTGAPGRGREPEEHLRERGGRDLPVDSVRAIRDGEPRPRRDGRLRIADRHGRGHRRHPEGLLRRARQPGQVRGVARVRGRGERLRVARQEEGRRTHLGPRERAGDPGREGPRRPLRGNRPGRQRTPEDGGEARPDAPEAPRAGGRADAGRGAGAPDDRSAPSRPARSRPLDGESEARIPPAGGRGDSLRPGPRGGPRSRRGRRPGDALAHVGAEPARSSISSAWRPPSSGSARASNSGTASPSG